MASEQILVSDTSPRRRFGMKEGTAASELDILSLLVTTWPVSRVTLGSELLVESGSLPERWGLWPTGRVTMTISNNVYLMPTYF